ncbi:hypothetical protein [Polyangium sp. 15x6]|uniref:hypothetical protein n=1 Tax=Polyangium sp. 15x6 TaxID=3042687 RepID=UPI00249B32EB|nr:hypothetical protein [Polyangium sp. 15x6]MDI3291028.1 hypothetical protein [Polyangium sp. 15x6]
MPLNSLTFVIENESELDPQFAHAAKIAIHLQYELLKQRSCLAQLFKFVKNANEKLGVRLAGQDPARPPYDLREGKPLSEELRTFVANAFPSLRIRIGVGSGPSVDGVFLPSSRAASSATVDPEVDPETDNED